MRFTKYKTTNVVIPDNDLIGVYDFLEIKSQHFPQSVALSIDVEHSYLEDLIIELSNPNGNKKIVLQPGHGLTTLKDTIFEIDECSALINDGIQGKWSLNIIDRGVKDEGVLKRWALVFDGIETSGKVDIEDNCIIQMEKHCKLDRLVDTLDLTFSIAHDHIGDLNIELISPSGVKKNLHNKKGQDENVLKMHWNASMLSDFVDLPSKGTWIFSIEDKLKGDEGALIDWNLNIVTKD